MIYIYIYIYMLALYRDTREIEKGKSIYLEGIKRLDDGKIKKNIKLGYVGLNLNYGNFFIKQSEAKTALKYYNKAFPYIDGNVKKNMPEYWLVYQGLSYNYAIIADYKKAMKYAKMILKIDGNNNRALNVIGFSYSHLGKYELALEYYKKALKYGNPYAKQNIEQVKENMKKARGKEKN